MDRTNDPTVEATAKAGDGSFVDIPEALLPTLGEALANPEFTAAEGLSAEAVAVVVADMARRRCALELWPAVSLVVTRHIMGRICRTRIEWAPPAANLGEGRPPQ